MRWFGFVSLRFHYFTIVTKIKDYFKYFTKKICRFSILKFSIFYLPFTIHILKKQRKKVKYSTLILFKLIQPMDNVKYILQCNFKIKPHICSLYWNISFVVFPSHFHYNFHYLRDEWKRGILSSSFAKLLLLLFVFLFYYYFNLNLH